MEKLQIQRMAAYYARRTVEDPERYGVQTHKQVFAHMVKVLS